MGKIIKPFREVSVNVILTFEYDVPEDIRNIMVEYCGGSQQMYDLDILVLKPKFRSSKVQNDWSFCGEYSPEKHVIGQVLNDLNPEELKPYLWKISLCYTLPENKSKKDCVWWENEFSFIGRTNSKYYFQPDQRDELVQLICEELDIATKTLSYKDWAEKNNVKDIPVAQNLQTAV